MIQCLQTGHPNHRYPLSTEWFISQLIQYSRVCGSYQDFLDRGLLLTKKLLNQGCLLVWHHFERFTVANMNCLTAKEYLYRNLPLICSTYRNTSRSVPDSLLITGFVTRVTRWVSLVEQELLTLPGYRSEFNHDF